MTTMEQVEFDLTGSPQKGLVGATIGFFFGFAAVSLYGPTASRFTELMDLSPFFVGILVSTPMLSGSILRIPFSAWVETTGGRKPFLFLLGLSFIGMVGVAGVIFFLYPSGLSVAYYPLLVFLGILSGCGIATFSVGISQVSYWYPQEAQGRALGVFAGFGNIAPGIFSFLIPIALLNYGLLYTYIAWLVFLLIGIILYYRLGRNAWFFQLVEDGLSRDRAKSVSRDRYGQEIFPTSSPRKSLHSAASTVRMWPLVFLYFTTFGGFLALTAWFPTYWMSSFELSLGRAGLLTGVFSVFASLIRVPGGLVSDRFGGKSTAGVALIILLIGSVIMTVLQHFILSIVGSLLIATGMGINNAAVFKQVPKEVPEAVGGASGWVGGLGAFGGFVIPPVMGLFVDRLGQIGYARGFSVFAGLSVISLLLIVLLAKIGSVQEAPIPTES